VNKDSPTRDCYIMIFLEDVRENIKKMIVWQKKLTNFHKLPI